MSVQRATASASDGWVRRSHLTRPGTYEVCCGHPVRSYTAERSRSRRSASTSGPERVSAYVYTGVTGLPARSRARMVLAMLSAPTAPISAASAPARTRTASTACATAAPSSSTGSSAVPSERSRTVCGIRAAAPSTASARASYNPALIAELPISITSTYGASCAARCAPSVTTGTRCLLCPARPGDVDTVRS